MAGGDPMPVRTLNKPEIVAPVTFTLWLIANDGDIPRIRPEDEAMWERVRRIPIGATVPEERPPSTCAEHSRNKGPLRAPRHAT